MTECASAALQHAVTGESTDNIESRDARALTECMSVIPEGGDVYTVAGEGSAYMVDAREGRCTCPDYKHNLPTDGGRERCKHAARVAYATGDRSVPTWVDTDAVDEQLGEHTEAGPQAAATDGGIIEAGDDGEILEGDADERPEDCDCGSWNTDAELPCWACYREGFDVPNPGEPGAE